jgi:disulfide bond formation protein DsbB
MNATLTKVLRTRLVFLYVFLLCAALLAGAYYMQYAMRLEPCPLCIMQRIFFFAAGLAGLGAFLHNPRLAGRGQRLWGGTISLLAAAGGGFALRQIYLQHLPQDQIPQCLPSISYMLEADFPLAEVIDVLLKGDGNCAEVLWVDPVLGLGIPQWALVGFVVLAATGVWQALRK